MSLSRRGFTLAELVVALTLTAMLAGLTAGILARATARLRERGERMSGEQALRVAAGALRAGLESLGRDSTTAPDLAAIGGQGFTARATRAAGVLCGAGPSELVARSGASWWRALREPVAGRDSLLAGRLDAPAWRGFALQAAPRAARCPDGSAGIGLPVAADAAALAGLGSGSPLRVIEPSELRLYRAAPDEWLGQRLPVGGAPIQPLAGPLAPAGLALSYFRRDGRPALLPGEVGSVRIRVSVGIDSVVLFVTLPP